MRLDPATDVYTPGEIATAAGVPIADVMAALNGVDGFVPYPDAVRLGRLLAPKAGAPLFASAQRPRATDRAMPLVVSTGLHLVFAGAALVLTMRASAASSDIVRLDAPHADMTRLVYLSTPGPGGGGGGGGLLQKAPAPPAMREGRSSLSSPAPKREPPKPIEPAPNKPEPKPAPLDAEPLPAVVAPIVAAPADARTRAGVLEQTTARADSRGSGAGGGGGTGNGTGLGEGDGPGVGAGTGGGTGGGPYRAGSGIEPPRLLREVKADYSEDARRHNVEGEVVLEIVVRSDGSVGSSKILQGLGDGLNERAVQAVRQWRFAPARRLGTPVDVIVEVAVEFKLR